jgi:putative transposase
MIRGIDGLVLFRDDQDRENFISRLSQFVESTATKILAWALMDNHVHLLMFTGPLGISKFMRSLLTGYAITYNRKYQRSGHCQGYSKAGITGEKYQFSTTSPPFPFTMTFLVF